MILKSNLKKKEKEKYSFIIFTIQNIYCCFFNLKNKRYEGDFFDDYKKIKIINLKELFNLNDKEAHLII